MDVKKLRKAFEEIVEQIGLSEEDGSDIKIPKNADEDYFIEKLTEAKKEYIQPGDKFSATTTTVLNSIKVDPNKYEDLLKQNPFTLNSSSK